MANTINEFYSPNHAGECLLRFCVKTRKSVMDEALRYFDADWGDSWKSNESCMEMRIMLINRVKSLSYKELVSYANNKVSTYQLINSC